MEKQANNLINKNIGKKYSKLLLVLLLTIVNLTSYAQETPFNKGEKYILSDITVKGNTTFSAATIITYSGLRKGSEIQIPGDQISNAIKKLWKSNLFSDIEIYLNKLEGKQAYLEIRLSDLPELKELQIRGVKKGKIKDIEKETKLEPGVKVTENLIANTKNYLTNKYKKDGYYNTKININTTEVQDSVEKVRVNMLINIDRGHKVKIKEIAFTGNTILSDKKLRKAMKNTKRKVPLRFYKRSKYIEEDYKTDLVSVIDKFKEIGYRDARILSDSLVVNDAKTISLYINVEEGEKYNFGKISFIGNSVYTDQQLNRILRIKEGDTYNGVLLQKRIADNTKPDANDITNLYQNTGYLFSSINPVETSAEGNIIDMEIRISEGKPTYFNSVSVKGNEVTNDKVIYRELRTRPGQLYSKENVIRTIRELSQLNFFDAEQITTDFKNPNPNEGTIDLEYGVVETGSSQIELQGGYGGGGFIGTLGLAFNNFSIKNIFNGKAYKPVPRGDGQKLSLRLQASRFFRTYSFSFTEPWLGGKKPVQFSTSVSHSNQFLYDSRTGDADKNRRFNITGLSVGLAKRLNVPDDFFTLSQGLSYQHYNLKNYNTGLFTFGNGYSNNLAYSIGLSRNNTYNDPIYPLGGSNFSINTKLSIPYSLFNNVDYKALANEREEQQEILNDPTNANNQVILQNASDRIGEIDQERFKWLEFYKIEFRADWYAKIVDKLVLRPSLQFGFLGAFNNNRGVIPFERFFLGGDGLGNFSLDGREVIGLRGYPNQSLQPEDENGGITDDGGSIYNKFSLELRYPITLKQAAKIYALSFVEGGVSYNNFKDYNPFDLKRSAGLGLRVFMPAFGLLGIDFGYGFDPIPGQGNNASGWQTHFIIGQQF